MPKSLTIFGRNIKVKYLSKNKMDAIIPGAAGIWESTNQVIFICNEYSKEYQKYTLKHEVGHAIMSLTGLDQVIQAELQEIIVQSYATLIEDILKQASRYK
jgi:Zn-dependent peptidase ImmA (M78 family)